MRLFKSKSHAASQKSLTNHRPVQSDRLNALSRQIRILKGEIIELNRVISILKRDVARIDRQGYRDKAASFDKVIQGLDREGLPVYNPHKYWGV